MEQIRLDIIPKGLMPVCHSSQYDKGRVIRLNLVDGLQGYTLTDETVTLNVRKPDNNIVTAGVNVVSGASYVDIVTTEQMTACEGENLCEIVITKGDVKIASLNFKMKVEVDPLKDGIESETEIHNLETQIADINAEIVPPLVADEVANQYDSSNVIFDDTPTENHGTGYAVTSEGVKAYVDNKPNALVDLTDVDIDNPTSNQALVWDTTEEKWVNGEVSTVGSIDDLDDVDTTGKATGDNLRYNGNEWVAKPNTIEMTLAEWNAIADKQAWRNAHKNIHLVITDAPNLNATAQDISYDGGADTVWDKVEGLKTVTSGTVTPQTGYIDHGSYIKKCGRLVLVHINLEAPTAISNRTWVGALSGTGMLPPATMRFCGCGASTHDAYVNRVITGYITTDGNIYFGDSLLNSSTSAIDLFCDISYFV